VGLRLFSYYVLCLLLAAGCGPKATDIKTGDSRQVVFSQLGAPDKWMITPETGEAKGILDARSLPKERFSTAQPTNELWVWQYGSTRITLADDRVVDVSD
jgi:hypothetical protein